MPSNLIGPLSLAIVFPLAGLAGESNAWARPRTNAVARQNAKAARAMTALEVANALQSAHALLVQADRDYAGHRALAAKEVEKALQQIGHRYAAKVPTSASVNPAATAAGSEKVAAATSGKAEREAQAKSDAQLRQAQQVLQQALMYIDARHPKAAANVQAAIGEINTALSIK